MVFWNEWKEKATAYLFKKFKSSNAFYTFLSSYSENFFLYEIEAQKGQGNLCYTLLVIKTTNKISKKRENDDKFDFRLNVGIFLALNRDIA